MATSTKVHDVVIVGGGIYGVSVAYDLAMAGKSVLLLEADEIACGASGGQGERGIRAANRDLRELPIVALSQERWKHLQETIDGGIGYRRIGSLQVFDIPYGHRKRDILGEMEARAAVQSAFGVPTILLERREVLEREPELAGGIAGALYCPNDGVADHTFATRQLAMAACKAGAVIRTNSRVSEIVCERGAARAVRLASGETVSVGEQLVLFANAGTPELMRPFSAPHEMFPVWQIMPQMLFVSNPDKRRINHLLSHRHRRLAVKQVADGSFMISGGGGVEPTGNGGVAGSLSTTALSLVDAIATFPFLDSSEFLRVDVTRTDTVALDGIPIIGRAAAVSNITFGFGWCGHGFAISLGFARIIADWIMTGTASPILAPFSPERFSDAAGRGRSSI